MGNTKLRRLLEQENRWTDKSCKRHQHEFYVPCIVRLSGDSKKHIGVDYYSAVKCKYCHSFRYAHFIPRESEALDKAAYWLLMDFKKSHFGIGMQDITYLGSTKPEKKSGKDTD
jgi:hypothetical protein